ALSRRHGERARAAAAGSARGRGVAETLVARGHGRRRADSRAPRHAAVSRRAADRGGDVARTTRRPPAAARRAPDGTAARGGALPGLGEGDARVVPGDTVAVRHAGPRDRPRESRQTGSRAARAGGGRNWREPRRERSLDQWPRRATRDSGRALAAVLPGSGQR